MSITIHPSLPQAASPLPLDSTTIKRRSLEISPSRSSVRPNSSQSQAHTPSSSVPNTPLLPTRPPSPEKRPPHPADSNSFLTALAAQERRVLELREELQKADEDLERLKKQWAMHEATKKKNELRHLQQLQPLNTPPLGSSMPSNDESAGASREFDRQRITTSIKPSYRKVFAGSRHTQELSLLSRRDPRSHSNLLLRGSKPSKPHHATANDVVVPATVLELSSVNVESGSDDSYRGPQKDVIVETGKQLVGDFRQGLWTFFEDFKQLTVGDEGISTAGVRNPPVIASGNMPRRQSVNEKRTALKDRPARTAGALVVVREETSGKPQIEVSGSKQRVGSSLDRPTEAVGPVSNSTAFSSEGGDNAKYSDSDDNGWDSWDTPKVSTTRRKDLVDGADPMASPLTDRSSPRTSMSSCDATHRPTNHRTSIQDRDDIPWPALTKLTPGSLKRTASTLMSEWERSLAPKIHDEADLLATLASTNVRAG